MFAAPAPEAAPSGRRPPLPSPPPQVGFTLHRRRRLGGIRFPFLELGCLRLLSAPSAKPGVPAQSVAVIYLRAWPVLPRPALHPLPPLPAALGDRPTFRPQQRRLSVPRGPPAGRLCSHRCLPAPLQRQRSELAQDEAASQTALPPRRAEQPQAASGQSGLTGALGETASPLWLRGSSCVKEVRLEQKFANE